MREKIPLGQVEFMETKYTWQKRCCKHKHILVLQQTGTTDTRHTEYKVLEIQ